MQTLPCSRRAPAARGSRDSIVMSSSSLATNNVRSVPPGSIVSPRHRPPGPLESVATKWHAESEIRNSCGRDRFFLSRRPREVFDGSAAQNIGAQAGLFLTDILSGQLACIPIRPAIRQAMSLVVLPSCSSSEGKAFQGAILTNMR